MLLAILERFDHLSKPLPCGEFCNGTDHLLFKVRTKPDEIQVYHLMQFLIIREHGDGQSFPSLVPLSSAIEPASIN